MEQQARSEGRDLRNMAIEEFDSYWEAAKQRES
jgi:uncharacterized protein YabN with tetrapyrrole methylase and pyrophosphatase domain